MSRSGWYKMNIQFDLDLNDPVLIHKILRWKVINICPQPFPVDVFIFNPASLEWPSDQVRVGLSSIFVILKKYAESEEVDKQTHMQDVQNGGKILWKYHKSLKPLNPNTQSAKCLIWNDLQRRRHLPWRYHPIPCVAKKYLSLSLFSRICTHTVLLKRILLKPH